MLKRLKLRSKMLVFFLGFNLLISLVFLLVNLMFSGKALVAETENRALERVQGSAAAIQGFLKEKSKVAWTFGHDPDLIEWLEQNTQRGADRVHDQRYQRIIRHFKSVVAKDSFIKSAFMACELTQEYFDDAERETPKDYQVGQRPWYRDVVQRGEPAFDTSVDLLDQKVYMSYNVPVYNAAGRLLGVTGIDISLEALDKFISTLRMFERSQAFVVGSDGTYLFHPDRSKVLKGKLAEPAQSSAGFRNVAAAAQRMFKGESGIDEILFDGREQYLIYSPLPELRASLVLAVPSEDVNAPLTRLVKFHLVVILFSLIGLILILVPFTNSITRPIEELAEISRRISKGDTSRQLTLRRSDEIGTLAESFRELVAYVRGVAGAAEALSKNDRNYKIVPKSEQDILSSDFININRSIYGMMDELTLATAAAKSGNLTRRCEVGQFQGAYRELMSDVNEMLEAVIQPISAAVTMLDKVASNDLTARLDGDFRGDFARMRDALNRAIDNLRSRLVHVEAVSDSVAAASLRIRQGSQVVAQGTRTQSGALHEVSTSLHEMSSLIQDNARNAKQAHDLADRTRESADRGADSVQRLSEAIDRIKVSSDKTARIVKTIDEIAFQTNLLALNAAVEAARAGEAGRGFAVVAEEVRGLALRSAEAAKNTALMIDEAVQNANAGVLLNEESLRNLQGMNQQIRTVSGMLEELAVASEQQQRGIEQMTKAIEQMGRVTQEHSVNSMESAQAAEALSEQAEGMRKMVAEFRLHRQSDPRATSSDLPMILETRRR